MADTQWQYGVSLKKENLEKFKTDINEYIEKLELTQSIPIINIDMEIDIKTLSLDTVKEIKKLEPFGESNETPIFAIKNVKISSIRAITEGEHLKLTISDGNTKIDAIGFHLGGYVDDYKLDDKIDIVRKLRNKRIQRNGKNTNQHKRPKKITLEK